MGQLGLEGLQVVVRREVVLCLGPGRDRVDDAVDELLDAGLALGRAEVAAEVLADDDVGGQLAPEVGDLDVLLLEDALARFVGDAGGPVLPGDLVVGVDARAGPAALEGEALGAGLAVRLRAVEGGAPRAGVAVGGGLGGLRGGGLVSGGVRVLRGGGLRRRILDVDRAAGASGHLCLSSSSPVAAVRGSCRVLRVVVLADHPGGRSRTGGLGRRGACRGRRGEIRRPLERYACREGESSPKTQDVVVRSGGPPLHVVVSAFRARPRSAHVRGVVVHVPGGVVHRLVRGCARGRPPVRGGCPRVVHSVAYRTSVRFWGVEGGLWRWSAATCAARGAWRFPALPGPRRTWHNDHGQNVMADPGPDPPASRPDRQSREHGADRFGRRPGPIPALRTLRPAITFCG